MRWKLWVIFDVVQCAGFMLPSFANVHSNIAPLFLGWLLLFPGSFIVIFLQQLLDKLPGWEGYLDAGVPIVCVNALVWYLVTKFNQPEIKIG
jgi:hypothetical protein